MLRNSQNTFFRLISESRPTVTVHFMHILRSYSADHTLFDDFGVFTNDVLNDLKVFHRNLYAISEVA